MFGECWRQKVVSAFGGWKRSLLLKVGLKKWWHILLSLTLCYLTSAWRQSLGLYLLANITAILYLTCPACYPEPHLSCTWCVLLALCSYCIWVYLSCTWHVLLALCTPSVLYLSFTYCPVYPIIRSVLLLYFNNVYFFTCVSYLSCSCPVLNVYFLPCVPHLSCTIQSWWRRGSVDITCGHRPLVCGHFNRTMCNAMFDCCAHLNIHYRHKVHCLWSIQPTRVQFFCTVKYLSRQYTLFVVTSTKQCVVLYLLR